MSYDAIGTVAASLDAPITVVTVTSDEHRAGCVVGFQTQCSIAPVRYAVWLSKANHTYRVALFATHFAVHFLNESNHDLAQLFGGSTGDAVDKFEACDWSPGPFGVPLLSDCPTRIVLERTAVWDDGGDHVCLVGQPIDAAATDFVPLRLSAIDDVDAGHGATQRAVPHDLTASRAPVPGPDARTKVLEDIAAGSGHPIDVSPVLLKGRGPNADD